MNTNSLNHGLSRIIFYDIFFTSPVAEIVEVLGAPKKLVQNENIKNRKSFSPVLSPMSKAIYDNIPTVDKKPFLDALKLDNDIQEEFNEIYDNKDPDYQDKLANNRLGFYMEDFVVHHYKCPNPECNNKLLKYLAPNTPVVDLICSNKDYHLRTNTCFLYQVKTKVEQSNYFSKLDKYVTIGSPKFSEIPHQTLANDDIKQKRLTIGYFCLALIKNPNSETKYSIDSEESFILYPKLNEDNDNKYYNVYGLKPYRGRTAITWLPNVELLELPVEWNKLIDTNTVFLEDPKNNPYIDLPRDTYDKKWNTYIGTVAKKLDFD